jgi:hypothetical protein
MNALVSALVLIHILPLGIAIYHTRRLVKWRIFLEHDDPHQRLTKGVARVLRKQKP